MNKTSFTLFGIAIFLISSFQVIYFSPLVIAESREEIRQNRQEVNEARCQISETRIENKINQYNSRKDSDYQDGQNFLEKLNNLITKLDEKEIDSSELKKLESEANQQFEERKTESEEVISSLEITQDYACGESEGEFLKALEKSRQEYQDLIIINQELRETLSDIQNEIKEIQASV